MVSFKTPEKAESFDETTGITTSTEVFRKIGFATPKLVISQNAGLKVLQGAQIRMQSFIDSLTKIVGGVCDNNTENFLDWLNNFSEKHGIKFTITISDDETLATEGVKKYF